MLKSGIDYNRNRLVACCCGSAMLVCKCASFASGVAVPSPLIGIIADA